MPDRRFLPLLRLLFALPPCLLMACGAAYGQLKMPAQNQPKGGTGMTAPAAPAARPEAPKPAAAGEAPASDSILQDIANCMLVGLPQGWRTAQVQVIELSYDGKKREFEAKYAYTAGDGSPVPYIPCDAREPAVNVYKLNGALEPDKREWSRATLTFSSEGKFDLTYDYPKKE